MGIGRHYASQIRLFLHAMSLKGNFIHAGMKKAYQIQVRGRVQGVGFRYFTRQKAGEFGISGFACNMPDGSVYIEAEGEEACLEQFVAACRRGPGSSLVKDFDIIPCPPCNHTGFEIR
jgi:acylphosphatase